MTAFVSANPHDCARLLRTQDSWDEDDAFEIVSRTKSPITKIYESLIFLSEVQRLEITELSPSVLHPTFAIHIYLCDEDKTKPTYSIERTLSEFEQLRNDIVEWSARAPDGCDYCTGFQEQGAVWEEHWPRSLLGRLFGLSNTKSETLLQSMMNDMLTLARSQIHFKRDLCDLCDAQQQIPQRLTAFLVPQELTCDE